MLVGRQKEIQLVNSFQAIPKDFPADLRGATRPEKSRMGCDYKLKYRLFLYTAKGFADNFDTSKTVFLKRELDSREPTVYAHCLHIHCNTNQKQLAETTAAAITHAPHD